MITSRFGYFEVATFVKCDLDKIRKEKKKHKQRNDTSQGITGNVLHLRVALKEDVKMLYGLQMAVELQGQLFLFFPN